MCILECNDVDMFIILRREGGGFTNQLIRSVTRFNHVYSTQVLRIPKGGFDSAKEPTNISPRPRSNVGKDFQ